MRRIRRFALWAGALLVVAAVVGAVYETAARRRAVREHPPLGRRVDVGGRGIQLDCRGSGSPVVVLEAGLDLYGSLGWEPVHDSIAATTRTCAYSRAGLMWSDPAPGAFDSRRAAADLHAALAAAGERAPWVLVGHSLGGPYALTFTGLYPAEVAGLVLVDASHPDQVRRMRAASGVSPSALGRAREAATLAVGPTLARLGLARLLSRREAPDGWTPAMEAAYRAFYPTSAAALAREARAFEETLRTAGGFRRLGDRPLVVLTAAIGYRAGMSPEQARRMDAAWDQLQAEQAAWSARGRREVVDASHYIHHDRPAAVVRSVREVVAEVRASAPAPR
jgi:pimeloyl-ACP methyl ester carboxylesterase